MLETSDNNLKVWYLIDAGWIGFTFVNIFYLFMKNYILNKKYLSFKVIKNEEENKRAEPTQQEQYSSPYPTQPLSAQYPVPNYLIQYPPCQNYFA